MRHRGQFSRSERVARSRLAKLLHNEPFLCGSLVSMRRVCGKQGCKCTRGRTSPESVSGHSGGRETQDDPYSPDAGIHSASVGRKRIKRLGD